MKKLAAIFTALLLLAGCSQQTAVEVTEDFLIITSFYPVYIFTTNIVGDAEGVSVQNLTDSGVGCLHDYNITPVDMKLMERADLLIINGAGMEPFMDSVPEGLSVVDSSEGVELIEDNPHIWLSVPNAIKQVENITEGLCKADSINAPKYRQNAKEYISKLNLLDGEIREATAGGENTGVITFHEAFPYFAAEYGLKVVATVHVDGESEPGAAQLADIIEIAGEGKVAAIFTEPQYSPKSAQLISNETGVPIYELDPVVTGEINAEAYEKVMRKNIETLKILNAK